MNPNNVVMKVGKDGTIVGHVPRNVSWVISFFLKKDGNPWRLPCSHKDKDRQCIVLDLDYIERPCIYKFHKRQPYVDRLKRLLSKPCLCWPLITLKFSFSAINVAEFSNKLESNVSTTKVFFSDWKKCAGEKGAYVMEKVTRVCDECVDEGVIEVLMMDGTWIMRSIWH